MLDTIVFLEDGDAKYPLAYNFNVMEKTEKKYGNLEGWVKAMDTGNGEPSYEALIFMMFEMINEGIDIENEKLSADKKLSFLTEKQVGRLITRIMKNIGMEKLSEKIFKVMRDSMPQKGDSKNEIPMQNQSQ